MSRIALAGSSSSAAAAPLQVAHLREQLAHLARARARRRLVGHRRHPLDESRAEQAAERHQHQAHGAVAADPVARARGERGIDHGPVHRIEDDHGLILQAQLRSRVDPVAAPAARRAAADASLPCSRRPGRR